MFPAYVKASKFVTWHDGDSSSNTRMKAEPMKPAPPVRKTVCTGVPITGRLASRFLLHNPEKRSVSKQGCRGRVQSEIDTLSTTAGCRELKVSEPPARFCALKLVCGSIAAFIIATGFDEELLVFRILRGFCPSKTF